MGPQLQAPADRRGERRRDRANRNMQGRVGLREEEMCLGACFCLSSCYITVRALSTRLGERQSSAASSSGSEAPTAGSQRDIARRRPRLAFLPATSASEPLPPRALHLRHFHRPTSLRVLVYCELICRTAQFPFTSLPNWRRCSSKQGPAALVVAVSRSSCSLCHWLPASSPSS